VKGFLKKNLVIVAAFSLPVILIVVVGLTAYLPSLLIKTNYNFVYAACDSDTNSYSYRCDNYLQQRYSVVDNTLVINDVNPALDSDYDGIPDTDENYSVRLFVHDTSINETREISPEEAQALTLNQLITAPDGVSVSSEFDQGADLFLVFDSGSNYGYYLVKGNARSKLNLINDQDRYFHRNNFQFIGWVIPGRN